MEKVFQTCFAPFKPLSSDELAVGLFSPFTIDFRCLKKSLDEKPPSLQWCTEAMFIIKKIHAQLLLYLKRSKVPTSWEGVNVLDAYMRVTLDLLDFCNSVKFTLSGLDRFRMMVDFMVKSLEDGTISNITSKIEFQRSKGENSVCNSLSDAKKWRGMSFTKESMSKVKLKTRNNSMQIIHIIGSTMSIISLLVFCSILHPIPFKIDEGFYARLPYLDCFSESIKELVASFARRFEHEQNTGRPVLYEKEMIEDALSTCQEQVVCAQETLSLLKKRTMALQEGSGLLECVVNELFEEVIKGRKQLVDLINANNET